MIRTDEELAVTRERLAMFERMLGSIREDVTRTLAYAQFRMQPMEDFASLGMGALPDLPDFITSHLDPFTGSDNSADWDAGSAGVLTQGLPPLSIPRPIGDEVGEDPASWAGVVNRNAPCPCGSGRKYKHCHGALA